MVGADVFARRFASLSAAILLPLLIGAAAGMAIVPATVFDWKLAIAAILAVPIVVTAVLRPRFGMLLLIFAMGFVEEFRGGIGDQGAGGDEYLRSERTPFYAATIGLPGLYIPDVLVLGLLLQFFAKALVERKPLRLRLDGIGVGLLVIAVAVLLSIVLGLAGDEPFGPTVLDLSTLGSITLPEKNVTDVARYLPVLQYKLFLIIFPAYLLGLLYFRSERDIRQTIAVLGVAMVGSVLLGGYRLATNPNIIAKLVPAIFDTGSVALMAMTAFYVFGMWACGKYRPGEATPRVLLSVAMLLFIALSYRRTMWGAIALAALFFPFILPPRARGRLLLLAALGLVAGLVVLGVTGPGQALLQSIMSRVQETNLSQSSTLYRFAIVTWLVDHVDDIPAFGYGLKPLWNEIVRIRFFVTSMENVHSLYMWILLRTGFVGFTLCGVGVALIFLRISRVYRQVDDNWHKVIVGVTLLSIVMYLFNGIFNPVYANVRHLVPLGLSLALVTNLPGIAGKRRRAPAPAMRGEALSAA